MKKKVILKSVHPEQYGDLEIECRVIENNQIGKYLESIPAKKNLLHIKMVKLKLEKVL